MTSLRGLTSFDSKNRIRLAPGGKISTSSTNLYAILVSMFGLDQATVVLKGLLSVGEILKNYSFYLIVLLNVYLAVSMCDSFELDLGSQFKVFDLNDMKSKLSERKDMLMIGVQIIMGKLDVTCEFDEVLSALKTYSNIFGIQILKLD